MSDIERKKRNFFNAIDRLIEGISKFDNSNDLLRDGLLQRFEFTFELSWKTLKVIFENEGLIGLNSPKLIFKEAFAAGLIEDHEIWLSMLHDRNTTSHIYNEKLAKDICLRIIEQHTQALKGLKEKIIQRTVN